MKQWSHESYRIMHRRKGEDEWNHWRTCGTELRKATRLIKKDRQNYPAMEFRIEKRAETHKVTEWEVVTEEDN